MLAVETNVLIYAHRRETAEHAAAAALLRELAEGPERWAIPWPCVYEFASVATNRRIWKAAASTPNLAWARLRAWQAWPTCSLIGETEGLLRSAPGLRSSATRSRPGGPRRSHRGDLRRPRGRGPPDPRPGLLALPPLTVRNPFAA